MQGFTELFSNDYLLIWAVYLLGVIGLLIAIWRVTRNWPGWLSSGLRVVGACLLLTPIVVDTERQLYAPAMIVIPFEWLAGGAEHAGNALSTLIQWSLIALLVLAIAHVGAFFIKRSRADRSAAGGENAAVGPTSDTPPSAGSD